MDRKEIQKKLGPQITDRFKVIIHDFKGPDIVKVGWVKGGPVYLNRHFLEADLRLCVGCVVPHNETGFGGGAKRVVPGLAGHLTIAHFHGALPPRPIGQADAINKAFDRRSWAEEVARHIRTDA
ncbi:DUF2088 domain-containing protein, partial [bacterium]|nr:DUF2088 domain-containing protein [bacterium]